MKPTRLTFLGFAATLCMLFTASGFTAPVQAETYYSITSGDPTVLANWNSARDGSGSVPADFITNGDVFVVQGTGGGSGAPHTMTNASIWTVGAAGNPVTLTIESDATLQANLNVLIHSSSMFNLHSAATYIHNHILAYASGILAGTEDFHTASNFIITSSATTGPGTPTGGYGNFTYDAAAGNVNSSGLLTNIKGNLTIGLNATGEFRLTGATALTLTVGGNLSIQAGTLNLGNGTASPVVNLGGNFSMTGGTLNYIATGGTVGTPVIGTIHFAGGGVQTFTKTGGTITAAATSFRRISFVVQSGTTLDMGTNILNALATTNCDFTVSSGGTVRLGDPGGIVVQGTLPVTGNIRTSAGSVRMFSTGGNYEYTGGVAQITGDGLPATVNNLIFNNPAGVTLTGATLVNGTFETNGGAGTAGNLTFNGIARLNPGGFFDSSPTYNAPSTLVYNTGGTYGRGNEWNALSGPGYPSNVQLSGSTTLNYPNGSTAARSIAGSLTIDPGSALYMDYGGPGVNSPLTVGGSVTLEGNLSLGDAVGGDMLVAGNWTNNGGSLFNNTRQVEFNGAGVQDIGGTSVTTFAYARMNNSAGASLSQDAIVSNTLTLTTGNISTGSNTLEIASGGSVSRTSGHIVGNMRKTMPSGASSRTFEIGDVSFYTPVDVEASTSYASDFALTASTAAGEHGQIGTSGIDAAKSVNRSYTLAGTPSGNSDIVFNFDAGDVDGGANTANFIVGKYNSPLWTLPAVGAKTATSTEATGVASFSDFIIGEVGAPPPAIIFSNGTGGGDWNVTSTWAGGVIPAGIDDVTILPGDSVFVLSDSDCDSLAVLSGGKLGMNAKLTTDIAFVAGIATVHNDTLRGDMTVAGTGQYVHARNGGRIPTATWEAGSTCVITGVTATAPGSGNQNFHHVVWNSPLQTGNVNMGWDSITIGGDITVVNTSTGRWQMCAPLAGDSSTVTIMGDVIQSGGNFTTHGTGNANTVIRIHHYGNINVTGGNFALTRGTQGNVVGSQAVWYLYAGDFTMSGATTQNSNTVGYARFLFADAGVQNLSLSSVTFAGGGLPIEAASGTTLNAGTSVVRGSGAFTVNAGATLETGRDGGLDSTAAGTGIKTFSTSANYTFNGSTAQVTGILLPDTVNNLTVSNTAGVTLSDSVRVDGTLSFVDGRLHTGNNLVIAGASGAVSGAGAGKYVDGYLRKTISSGADSELFEIGDASVYAPVTVAGASYASAFDVTASTTAGEHDSMGTSGLDPAKSVNRSYTLEGSPTGSSDITLTFVPGDVDGGADPNDFVVAKFDDPAWTMTGVGTRTATSTQATGVTDFSDFAIGELPPAPAAVIFSNGTGGGLWSAGATWLGGVAPGPADTVVVVGTDSVHVGTIDQCSDLTVAAGAKLALFANLLTDDVSLLGNLVVHADTLRPSGTMVVGSTGVYQHDRNAGRIPTATWNAGSTILITGAVTTSPASGNQNFHHVIWNSPTQTANLNMGWDSITIGGNITVVNTSIGRWQMCAPLAGDSSTVTIMGDVIQSAGNFTTHGTGNANTVIRIHHYGNINVTGGNFSLTRGSQGNVPASQTIWYMYDGDVSLADATTQNSNTAGYARFLYMKAGTQNLSLTNVTFGGGGMPTEVAAGTTLNIGDGVIRGSGAFTLNAGATLESGHAGGLDSTLSGGGVKTLSTGASFIFSGSQVDVTGALLPDTVANLTLNTVAGHVSLSDSVSVTNTLNLSDNILHTGANLVEANAVVRTTGHVDGYLMKTIVVAAASEMAGGSATFEIGDSSGSAYTPVDIAGTGFSGDFSVVASTVSGDHPELATSGIDGAKSVNRYYTLSGTPTGPADITFTFDAGDVDGGANTASFIAEQYNGGWNGLTEGTLTATSTQVTGVTSFSDFAIGEGAFVLAPAFTASASSINFGNVDSGATKQDSLYVKNTGTATLNILSATSDDVEFVVAPPSAIIAAGDSAWFHVTYGPTAVEADAGNIVFGHDAASSPDTVTVSGNGVVPGASPKFLSVSPDTIIAKDPVKLKFLKPVKRAKPGKPITMPNWANLLDETVAQGGFGPGASTGDSAGGMVIGESFMFKKNPADPLKPKWSPVKESANLFAWVRLTKWDFKKDLGKGYNALQKTLENKTFNHMVDAATHRPRGFDSTLSPGMPKRKQMKKQATKLDPKKTPNNLFAELVALKVNIAASQMEKTPAGFGELIFDVDTSAFDEMEVKAISEKADSMMTHWQSFTPVDSAGANYSQYDDLYNAAYAINRAFVGVLDTVSFMQTDTTFILGKLRLEGQVSIDDVPYMKLPVLFRPVTIAATTWEVESGEEEDFNDEEWENEEGVPVAAKLYQNYPNPFNPSTKISFQLLETSQVTVKIFNMLGQEVASLFSNEEFEEGYNTVQFDATGLASGVYFYQIQAQGMDDAGLRTIATQKMVLLK